MSVTENNPYNGGDLFVEIETELYLGKIAKRLNAADCKSVPFGSGVRIPLFPLLRF